MATEMQKFLMFDYGIRMVIVEGPDESGEMPYDSTKVSDSEALHALLCYMNPGDEYTVTFKNKRG